MRILFVADGRSPIAVNWMRYLIDAGHEIHLASSFQTDIPLRVESLHFLNMAFSGVKGSAQGGHNTPQKSRWLWGANLVEARTHLRQWLGPLTLYRAARDLSEIAAHIKPDMVHAMRIPYEGMTAAFAHLDMPWLLSVWGNDFTLHARTTPLMKSFTRRALMEADAVHTDAARDMRLAADWGFDTGKPGIVLPSSGGVREDLFYPPQERADPPVIINPRGFRAYIRNNTFFAAIPQILNQFPDARFVCPSMQGEVQAQRWLEAAGCSEQVELLPRQTPIQMAELYRRAQVAVSPSIHDGTPNTLLEAMACGCFPVAGDLESLREWITPGINGLLIDPNSPEDLARAVISALKNPVLRAAAQAKNIRIIASRANLEYVMQRIQDFYERIVQKE